MKACLKYRSLSRAVDDASSTLAVLKELYEDCRNELLAQRALHYHVVVSVVSINGDDTDSYCLTCGLTKEEFKELEPFFDAHKWHKEGDAEWLEVQPPMETPVVIFEENGRLFSEVNHMEIIGKKALLQELRKFGYEPTRSS